MGSLLDEIGRQYGLKVNKSKIKVIIVDRGNIILRSTKEHSLVMKPFGNFVYLESLLENKVVSEGEIRRKTEITRSDKNEQDLER